MRIPESMIGRFAVVKLWPKVKAAEDEFIARLKNTARELGLECIEITMDGHLCAPPYTRITQKDVDFVIHLHFETPKAYDIFSFVALWNPLKFYFDWDYRRYSDRMATHDDFISCGSRSADDHLIRLISGDPTRLPAKFFMYHSLSQPLLEPTLGEKKMFYIGMNWERMNAAKGRHHELLTKLDRMGALKIFGPKSFQGRQVWAGFKSYVGPLPFDGRSIIEEINKAGIALVFSSDSHKDAELMSARLYESAAAGAVIIADDHPFARREFGDCLLYVDPCAREATISEQVMVHWKWIKANPDKALEMAKKAQEIFKEKFILTKSITALYEGLRERQAELAERIRPEDTSRPVTLYFMVSELTEKQLQEHITSYKAQTYPNCRAVFVLDATAMQEQEKAGKAIVKNSVKDIVRKEIPDAEFLLVNISKQYKDGTSGRRRAGEVISNIMKVDAKSGQQFAVCFVAPSERLFSDHVGALLKAMDRDKAIATYSDMMCRHRDTDDNTHYDLYTDLDLLQTGSHKPQGYARFLFQPAVFDGPKVACTLPYLDLQAASWLASVNGAVRSHRATLINDIQNDFLCCDYPSEGQDQEIMRDVSPELIAHYERAKINKTTFIEKFYELGSVEKIRIYALLFRALPMPWPIKQFVQAYRWWALRWLRKH